MPLLSLSSSARVFGSMAKVMAGSAKRDLRILDGRRLCRPACRRSTCLSASRPRQCRRRAARSRERRSCPASTEMWANFSAVLRVKFCTVASFFSTPENTLKNEMRPAKGSLTVLKTKSESGSESLTLRLARLAVVGGGSGAHGVALGRRRHVVDDEVQHLVRADVAQAGRRTVPGRSCLREWHCAGRRRCAPRRWFRCRRTLPSARHRLRRPVRSAAHARPWPARPCWPGISPTLALPLPPIS